MFKPTRSAVSVAILSAALAVACGDSTGTTAKTPDGADGAAASGGAQVGSAAPELKAERLTGEGPASLGDLKGKVTVVDFWATHCDACKKSFPEYQKLVDQHGGKLQVIAVACDNPEDKDKPAILDWVKQTGVKFPIVWDTTEATQKAYAVPNLPTAYLIGKDGVLRHIHSTYNAEEEQKIHAEIQALIEAP